MAILVVLITLLQTVTLRGTVFESDKAIADAVVTIQGDAVSLKTTSASDGTFQFHLPRTGSYTLTANHGRSISMPSTIFVNQDIDGVGVVLRPSANPVVLGRILVDGDQGLPSPLPKLVVKYTSGNIAARIDVSRDGSFFFVATPVEFNLSVDNLAKGYYVKSMFKGKDRKSTRL